MREFIYKGHSLHEATIDPHVRGVVVIAQHGIYIPLIRATRPGRGDVGRFLDKLPRDMRVVFPAVISDRLVGMLARRGFRETIDHDGEHVWHRVPFWERQ